MALSEKKFYKNWDVVVSGRRVNFKDREAFDDHLVPLDGKEMVLVLKDKVKERSRAEEKFYRGVVVPMIAEEMGASLQPTHEMLAKFFLTVEEKTPAGYRFSRVQSTTELSDKAYRKFWNDCIKWAALPTDDDGLSVDSGLSLYIPMPNEVDYSQV